jgi:hypothetical protein
VLDTHELFSQEGIEIEGKRFDLFFPPVTIELE